MIVAQHIRLRRVEGPRADLGTWGRERVNADDPLWEAAKRQMHRWSQSAPRRKDGGYDKVYFTVTFADGEQYHGRCDIRHWSCRDNDLDVAAHIRDFLRWHIDNDHDDDGMVRQWLNTYALGDDC